MGYETKIIIGKSTSHPQRELKHTDVPYKDGSGFELERDDKGNFVPTGNTEHWFQIYATMDMCKLSGDDPLNELIDISFKLARSHPEQIHFFYADDGNTKIKEDKYGARMFPVPLKDLALALSAISDISYRRLRWLKTLVDEMVKDRESLQVMFFGY